MSASRKKNLIIILCIILAALCNIMAHNITESRFPNKLLNAYRTFFYIGLFAAWGVSVRNRVMQRRIRIMLETSSLMMVMWLIIRVFKYRFVINYDIIRYMWYTYYIPLLLIPTYAVLVSISIGKTDDHSFPKWFYFIFTIPVILILLVLSNDYHQLVFRFPDTRIWTDEKYSYGIIYYLIILWMILCSVVSIITMIKRSKIPENRTVIWFPVIPFALGILYTVLFVLNIPMMRLFFGDIAIFFCLVFAGFFEVCISCGLIPSNTMYSYLFSHCKDLNMLITDRNYNICYSSDKNISISQADMQTASDHPYIMSDGKRLHSMMIDAGYAIWTEDISEIVKLKEALSLQLDELNERRLLLEDEYEKEKQHRIIKEQNRLYDLLQSITQRQINMIDGLVRKYRTEPDILLRNNILSCIMVLGTYIKRRKDFLLSSDSDDQLPEVMLSNAFEESFHALEKLSIHGSHYVDTGEPVADASLLTRAYDFFEDVIELLLITSDSDHTRHGVYNCLLYDHDRHHINVRVCRINSELRVNILTDLTLSLKTKEHNAAFHLNNTYHDACIEEDEDGTFFLLALTPSKKMHTGGCEE